MVKFVGTGLENGSGREAFSVGFELNFSGSFLIYSGDHWTVPATTRGYNDWNYTTSGGTGSIVSVSTFSVGRAVKAGDRFEELVYGWYRSSAEITEADISIIHRAHSGGAQTEVETFSGVTVSAGGAHGGVLALDYTVPSDGFIYLALSRGGSTLTANRNIYGDLTIRGVRG